MKKEASGKKGKLLWLWIVIAVVLVGAIVAGIIFLPGLLDGNKDGDAGLELYWNVDREENTDPDTGLSIRQPAEDGNYYVRFAHNGEQVEIPVGDKKLVNYIDSLDLMGLSFDENGFVVDIFPVKDIASVIGESLYVQSVSGDTVIANSSIMMNGRKVTIKLNDGLAVYNVSGKGEFVGEKIEASELNPMDTISIYGTLVPEDSEEEPVPTHIFVLNKPAESEIYFRADQFYDSSNKVTTREPDENGAYTIKWYCNGETVELKCKDKAMVSTIDSADSHWCHWGLEFDEEGYIIDIIDSFLASRTLMQCERFDITEIDDAGNYVATSLIKNNGAFVQGTVGADCPIYDISSTAKSEGQDNRKVDSLKLGDRVCIWTDTMGNPVQIYVTRRQAECDYYFVVTRSYSSTTLQTTRTPNENGYYEIELLKAGDTKNTMYYTKDIEIATAIDKPSDRVCGLKLSEGNIIECVYDLQAVFGNTYFVRSYFVLDATGSVATYLSPAGSGYTKNGVLAAGAKVWNVSTIGQYGAETTVQPGDTVLAGKTPIGELAYAYVTGRLLENGANKFYWRIDDRQYDSTKKVTTREPVDGWYTYLFAHNGKQVTLKTNNIEFATALDYQSSAPAFALETKGDIITAVHAGTYAYGGSRYNGWTVDAINGDEIEVTSSSGTKGTWNISQAKIYNVSTSHVSHKGEQIYSLKVGDVIANYRDINCTPMVIIVKTRETNKMAFPYEPVTDRPADENGWYKVKLAVDGKLREYTVKSKTVMEAIDAYTSPFGIEVKDDEILYMSTTTYVENVKGAGVTTYTVQSASGSSAKVIYTLGHSENTGKTENLTFSSNVKIYDVSPEAKAAGKFGETAKLKKGDVIRTYKDNDNNHLYVYILAHNTREIQSYCAHCDKNVFWTPYIPSSNVVYFDTHYYLATDLDLTAQMRVYSTARDFEIVLDLNGKTMNRTGGRAGLIRYGDTLTIIDTSADKSGKIMTKDNTSNGGLFMVSASKDTGTGVLNIGTKVGDKVVWGGTLTLAEDSVEFSEDGGLITNSGIINIYDGLLTGGVTQAKDSDGASGGAINSSGTINMFGGEISGNTAIGAYVNEAGELKTYTGGGGNISSSGIVNVYGGVIKDGVASRGGNIFVEGGTFTLYDGTIENGMAALEIPVEVTNLETNEKVTVMVPMGKSTDARGGNIFSNGDVFIRGGIVKDGVTLGKDYGGNIMSTGMSDGIYISGGTVTGGYYLKTVESDPVLSNIYLMYSNLEVSGGVIDGGALTGNVIGSTGTNTGGYSTITIAGGTIKGNVTGGGNEITILKDEEGKEYYVSSDTNYYIGYNEDGSAYYITASGKHSALYPNYKTVFNLSGGKVEGVVKAASAQSIKVSGKPVVDLLESGSNLLELGAMEAGADITIDAIGIFTKPNAKAADYKSYFKTTNSRLTIEVTANNELKFKDPDAVSGPCEHCGGADADWIPWSGGSMAAGAHYFLNGNVQLEEKITVDGAVVLDLKGFTVEAVSGLQAFQVNGEMSVLDSSDAKTGTITGGKALDSAGSTYVSRGGNFIVAGGTLNIYGGNIVGGEAVSRGGNIYATGKGVVNIYGGVISGGKADSHANNIFANYSTINIYGGEIVNTASNDVYNVRGAGYDGKYAYVNVYGGTISGGAGAVRVDGELAEAVISGGNISGKVYMDSVPSFKLEGKPVIESLTLVKTVATVGELTDGASITLSSVGVISAPFADKASAEAAAAYFAVPAGVTVAVNDNNEIVAEVPPAATVNKYCEHCEQNVDFEEWYGAAFSAAGHYILVDNVALTDTISIAKDTEIVLNLNGYTLTAASGAKTFDVSGDLIVVDSSGTNAGTITGGVANGSGTPGRGGNIYVQSSGNFTLYAGSITNGVATGSGTGGRGGNIFGNGGNITLKGGVVSNGTANDGGSKWGGNIFMTGGTLTVEEGVVISGGSAKAGGNIYLMYADMVVTGGEIKEGTVTDGVSACVYLNGTETGGYSSLTISGGIIDGAVYSGQAANTITVSGTAQLTVLKLNSSVLTVGELTTGASIKIDATAGAFTDVVANANDVVAYFDAVDAAYNVAVSADGKLEVVADGSATPPTPPVEPEGDTKSIFCQHCQTTVEFKKFVLTENSKGNAYTAESGHYFIGEDLTLTMPIAFSSGKDVVIDLNGKTITANGCRAFNASSDSNDAVKTTLSIQGEGIVTGGSQYNATANPPRYERGGNIYAGTANLNLYGGTYINGTSNTDNNYEGHNVAVYNGKFVMNGNVTIGNADKAGHSLYLFSTTGVELVKGNIVGKALFRTVTDVTLGSEVNVDYLAMRGSNFAVIEARNNSDKIAVKITNGSGEFLMGAFTSALDNAATAVTYFKSATADYEIVVNADNKLELVENTSGGNPGGGTDPVPGTAPCSHCGTDVEWTEWAGQTESGHYYLTKNETISAVYTVNGEGVDVVIDLRGYNMTGSSVDHVLAVTNGATLSICDTVGNGVITGAYNTTGNGRGGNVYVYNNGTFNLYGGIIADGKAKARGGNIYATGANVNIYGGSVINGYVDETVSSSDPRMLGGNIYIYDSKLTISGNAVIANTVDGDGEAIYVRGYSTPSEVVITGGTIAGEVVLREQMAKAEFSGAVVVNEITLKSTSTKIALVTKLGAFEEGASVNFNTMEGALTTANAIVSAADLAYVGAVEEGKTVALNANNELVIAEGCPCGCGALVTEVDWQDANAYFATKADGYAAMPETNDQEKALKAERRQIVENVHLKLSADLNITELYGAKIQLGIGIGADADKGIVAVPAAVTIDLNGFTLTNNYRVYINAESTLTMMDSSEAQTGTMTATGRNNSAHGGLFVNYGTLNILSGTYTQPAGGSVVHKGGIVYQSKGVFNLYGGTLIGGQALDKESTLGMGGNVHVYGGVFNMYGGTITGGIAGQGANVYLRRDTVLNMYDGIIYGADGNDVFIETGRDATINQVGGTIGTPDEKCPCGCGADAEAIEWTDANAYFAARAEGYANLSADDRKPIRKLTEDMHLKLSGDININEMFTLAVQFEIGIEANAAKGIEADPAVVVIDLNGFTWSNNGNRAFYVCDGSTLTILDTSAAGTGTIAATGSNGMQGRTIANYGTVNLLSGTLTMLTENNTQIVRGGGVVYQSKGVFNMYGGTITGGVAQATIEESAAKNATGGNVYINSGVFNMYDGVISNGTVVPLTQGAVEAFAYGSNVCYRNAATFNQVGGTIEGGAATIETVA